MTTRDFASIKGHQKNIHRLQSLLQKDTIPHAWIFFGKEGIGKHLIAETFAKGLLCKAQNRPCNICPSCRASDKNTHPDIVSLSTNREKKISVEEMRRALSNLTKKPLLGTRKILLLDDIKDLNKESSNTLLKNLEEPVGNVYYIFITQNIEKVLLTIRSRAISLYFSPLKPQDLQSFFSEQGIDIPLFTLEEAQGSIHQGEELLAKGKEELEKRILHLFERLPTLDAQKIILSGAKIAKLDKEERLFFFTFLKKINRDLICIYEGTLQNISTKYTSEEEKLLGRFTLDSLFQHARLIKEMENRLINTNINLELQIEIFLFKAQALMQAKLHHHEEANTCNKP